jgi:type IV pilus assembly protein PilM
MSFLQTLTSKLISGVFKSKANSVAGVDIGGSSIKVVELKKEHGKIILSTYGEVALGPYQEKPVGFSGPLDPDVVATALLDVLKEANVESRSAVVTIQSSASLLFTLELPASAEASLSEVLPNEARKYIPIPISEVTLNWNIIPRHVEESLEHEMPISVGHPNKGHTDTILVLVAAIRNDALAAYKNIIAQAGLQPLHYEIEIFSMIRSTFHQELAPVALIDLGASQTRVALVHYGAVMKYHTMNRGGMMITENISRSLGQPFERAEELKRSTGLLPEKNPDVAHLAQTHMMALVSEIKGSMLDFEKQYHKALDKAILVGGGAAMPGLYDMLSRELGLPIMMGDPFKKASNPEFLDPILAKVGPTFAGAVGAALYSLE